jgi:hypothetical protein
MVFNCVFVVFFHKNLGTRNTYLCVCPVGTRWNPSESVGTRGDLLEPVRTRWDTLEPVGTCWNPFAEGEFSTSKTWLD